MKKPILAIMLLLPCLLCGAEPEKTGEKKPEEKPKVVRPLDMTPEEVLEKMGILHQKAKEDQTGTIRESAEYRKLSEALPGVFRTLFSRRLREADHIDITEISFNADFIPLLEKGMIWNDVPKYEYASKRITPEQQALAVKAAEAMDLTMAVPTYCGFSPHHRMDITGKDGKVSTLLICYECLSVSWLEFPMLSEPEGIWAVLDPMMKQAGLETKKDWEAMAMEQIARKAKERHDAWQANISTWKPSDEDKKLRDAEPAAFKTLFVNDLREAARITITEMSLAGDFMILHMQKILPEDQTPKYDYASVNLNGEQKAMLLKAAEAIDLSIPSRDSYCGFAPHHRLEITGKDGKTSCLLICYECYALQWDKYPALSYPEGTFVAFEAMMASAGLDPDKDWAEIAVERYAKETKQTVAPDKELPSK